MHSFDIESLPEFDNHHSISFIFDKKTGLRGFIAIHRGSNKCPSLGATRLWAYKSSEEALKDALRLSKLMSYKAAIAGLPYGGAKATLFMPTSKNFSKNRRAFFQEYARKIDYLGGKFVTGTDVGVTDEDVKAMHDETDYVIGTKVNPAEYTGVSVLNALEVALLHATGNEYLSGRSFAIQGVGKTGSAVLEGLYKEAKRIYVSDIKDDRLSKVTKKFPNIIVIDPAKIHKQRVDAFVPCALSGVLNSKTVSELQCAVVAGSANNQLENENIDDLMNKLGIVYAPDYAANAGGLISVADEMEEGKPDNTRIMQKIEKVKKTLSVIFKESKKKKVGTNNITNAMAEKRFNNHK